MKRVVHLHHYIIFIVIVLSFITKNSKAQPSQIVQLKDKKIIIANIAFIEDSSSRQINKINFNHSHKQQNLFSGQRTNNNCGVVAGISPGNDSIFSSNILVSFTNTSVNAALVQWFVNGVFFGNMTILNYSFNIPGTYEIILVASNGNCFDTTIINYFHTGMPHPNNQHITGNYGFSNFDDYANSITVTSDSGFLTGGYTYYRQPFTGAANGMLIKQKKNGCIEWSRLIEAYTETKVYTVQSLSDSGFLISGSLQNFAFLMKINQYGTALWKKIYSTTQGSLFFRKFIELSDGTYIGLSSYLEGFSITRFSNTGSVIWNKFLKKSSGYDYPLPTALRQVGNDVFITGLLKLPDTSLIYTNPFNSFLIKIDPTNGQIFWTNMYEIPEQGRSIAFMGLHLYDTLFLINAINYNTLGGINSFQSMHFIDRNGNLLSSKYVKNYLANYHFPFFADLSVLPSKSIYLFHEGEEDLLLQPGFVNHSHFLKIDSGGTIYWQKYNSHFTHGLYKTSAFNGLYFGLSGSNTGFMNPAYYPSVNFTFQKIDTTGYINPDCELYTSNLSILPYSILSYNITWLVDSLVNVSATDINPDINEIFPQNRRLCPDYIDSCTLIRIYGNKHICNLNNQYIYRVVKNKKCTQPTDWVVEGPVNIILQNDTMIVLQFNSIDTFKVSATLRNSCNPVRDSIYIITGSGIAPVNLGSDTSLCPGNTLLLNAGSGYVSYLWQDNSVDSSFMVTAPGLYWVEVTDTCSNVFRDTIIITPTPPIPFDLGPDLTKCNNDSLTITAPSGFINYSWSPNYNINTTSGQTVIVFPAIDTMYKVIAEKTPGCFAFDSIYVNVNNSPPVFLGNDTSFCAGNSILLNAGPGFSNYLWSTGQTSPSLNVNSAGIYTVIATDTNNCASHDTLVVLNVFNNPGVTLPKDSLLCRGSFKILNAGAGMKSYNWNTGATTSSIAVNSTGTYWVTVTDNNGCSGSDSTKITRLLPLPSGFLPPDTVLCSYSTLQITTSDIYSAYLWNTGSTQRSITISQPGVYWLRATDNFNCTGTDTIVINPKQCLEGIFVPNAFTPNGDGLNDTFRPLLFGIVQYYKFRIYNRWGQLIYESTELGKGWDGKVSGKDADSNVFVWTCEYQFEGQKRKLKKGTLVLIR